MNTINSEKKIVVFFLDSIGLNRGGLTKAVFDRIELYLDHEYTVILISMLYDSEALTKINLIKDARKGLDNLIYFNLFHSVEGTHFSVKKKNTGNLSIESFIEPMFSMSTENIVGGRILRYFDNGKFVKLKNINKFGNIRYIDFHDAEMPHRIHRKEIYDNQGYKREEIFYSHDFKARYRVYYDCCNKGYLSAWINDTGEMYRLCLHQVNGETRLFPNIFEVQKYLLGTIFENLTLKTQQEIIVFADEPMTVKFMPFITQKNVKKNAVVHSNYNLVNDSLVKTGIKSWVASYNKPEVFEKLVFLTEESHQDFVAELKYPKDKTVMIRHCISDEAVDIYADDNQRNRRIISLSRLAAGKPIEDAIKAFALISHKFPDISYDIYGVGPNLKSLQNLITSLNMTEKIHLKGYTDQSLLEFSTSLCSVMMSTQEGFGLTTLESSSVGCPVIISDVKYGARDIVLDGKTGILVRPKNIKDISKAMEKLLSNDRLRIDMGLEAKKYVLDGFSKKIWENKWLALLK